MSELKKLGSPAELEAWIERSHREPVWVFKHSLTCEVSAVALAEFRRFAGEDGVDGQLGLIEVQTARELSNELARRTGVRHESPQALLLRDGGAVWHASHWRIRVPELRRAVGAAG